MPVCRFSSQRRVEFADTDMGRLLHFSRFFVFMETTEHQLLSRLGSSVHLELEGDEIGWPRLAASCAYKAPARFGDLLDIELSVLRKGRRAMTYGFLFRCADRLVAVGRLSSICCRLAGPRLEPIEIPAEIADQLEPIPDADCFPSSV